MFCKQSWEILMWTLPYPSSLSLEQPSSACTSLPDGCFPCEVFHDCEDHSGLLHQMPSLHRLARSAPGFLLSSRVLLSLSLPPLFSFSLHLLPSTFTSQSVVPSLATSQVPPWMADTGSEPARRYLGDSGQILFHVTCYSLTYSTILSYCLATSPPLLAPYVLFIAMYSAGA